MIVVACLTINEYPLNCQMAFVIFQEKASKLQLEVKTAKSALEREIARRATEGDEAKQLQGQLDIVMNKLKERKVIIEIIVFL